MAAGGRVSIPAGVRRTVADIKEIAGGHTDEEVYAMLRECNMDPNEAAQRLLLEDTFHEVKRKRDKKKEGSREPSDSRWRPALHGRGGKSGQGNYSSCSLSSSNDSAGRIAISGKENGINHVMEKGRGSTLTINTNMDVKASTSMASSSSGLPNGPSQLVDPIVVVVTSFSAAGDTIKSGPAASADLKGGLSYDDVVAGPNVPQPLRPASPSDFMAVPSLDSHGLGDDVAGASRQAIRSDNTSVEVKAHRDVQIDNKVIPSKEWKPKPTSSAASQATKNVAIPNSVPVAADTIPQSSAISNSIGTKDLLNVDKSSNGLQLSDKQHVIIPDHLQVSESEKYGLSFGSFSASFQQIIGSSDPECAKSSLPEYNWSHELNDIYDEPQPVQRDQNSSSPVQDEADHVPQQLPSAKLENCAPSATEISSIAPTESGECRDDSAASGVPQSTSVCTAPSYMAYGLAPQSHGNQIAVIYKSESQVQAPIEFLTSYSTQSYLPATDADERLSPFLAAESAHKYGNIQVIPAQTGQDHETEGSALWIPTPGRDISAIQANSFYGLAPQGQQVTFAPQAGPFGGIYHPAHTVAGAAVHPLLQPSRTMAGAVEIVGAPSSVYQQPQAQMNWGSY